MGLSSTFGRARARRIRVRHVLPMIGVVAAAAAFVVMPGSRGATTCQILPGLPIVQVNTDGAGDVTISRDTSGIFGAAIRVNGTSCGTVTTVDTIIVRATGGAQRLFIDTANGPFAPGKTAEAGSTSEIEFDVDLGDAEDLVQVLGSAAADRYNVGTAGWNLNLDNDGDDIKTVNVEGFAADGRAGDDIITGQGAAGAGTATNISLNVTGGAGADRLTGGNADDILKPGAGNDPILNGGAGTNTLDYGDTTVGVKVNLITGAVTGGSGNDTTSNNQIVIGGLGDDEVWDPEVPQRNTFLLGAGNDTCHMSSLRPSQDAPDPTTKLSDRCLGQAGNDWGDYAPMVHNSPGATIDMVSNKVFGSPEHDENDAENFIGSGGDDTIIDEDGQRNDVRAGDGDDTFVAGEKKPVNDAPDANGHSDNWDGGAGTDTVDYTATEHNSPGVNIDFLTNKVNGSPEYDTIPGVENAKGSTGDDTCTDADGERNVCEGGEGDDTFYAGVKKPVNDAPDESGKSDTWDGGEGNDTVDYTATEHNSPGVNIDFLTNKVNGSPEYDEIPGVENAVGSTGDDTCRDADGERNSCSMGEGDDTVYAGTKKPVNDDPDENGQSDDWDGGSGNNTLSYEATEHNSPGMTIDQLLGKASGSHEHDRFANFNLFVGSTGDDQFIHDPSVITKLEALAGNDELILSGTGTNASEFRLGEGIDKLNTAAMNVTQIDVNMPAQTVTAAGPADIVDAEDFAAPESGAQVNVVADDNANRIQGGNGNDSLFGAGGDDILLGGGGNDSLDCGTGNNDVASWEDSPNPVVITMSSTTPGSGTATGYGNDSFANCEVVQGSENNDQLNGGDLNDVMHGGGGNDELRGNNGSDTLYGDAGNDRLYGGNNDDTLFGGDGNDFSDGGNSNDTLYGGKGDDELHGGSNGSDTAYGGDGNDVLVGGNGPDALEGDGPNDATDPGTGNGNDIVDGGEGPDRCNGENEAGCEL